MIKIICSLLRNIQLWFIFRREDPRDAILLNSKLRGSTLSSLPEQSIIGINIFILNGAPFFFIILLMSHWH